MELTCKEWEVLRKMALYLTTDGKLKYSEMWDAYLVSNETVIMQDELDVLNKIAEG